jgi:hypothetical protein
VIAALTYVMVRDRWRPRAILSAAGATSAPLAVALVLNYAVWGAGGGFVDDTAAPTSHAGAFKPREFLSYLWQWYLPPLPFMQADFWSPIGAHLSLPVYEVFFKGFWADFGHLEIDFPGWVYVVLLVSSVAVLAVLALTAIRTRPRRDVLAAGLLLGVLPVVMTALLVNVRSYFALVEANQPFAQGRYLLQTVAVLGAALAAASVSLGDRRGRAVAVVMVVCLAALNAFSLGLVLVRFYT